MAAPLKKQGHSRLYLVFSRFNCYKEKKKTTSPPLAEEMLEVS